METKKHYNVAIDCLRILSIVAVVAVHTTTRTLEISSFAIQKIPFTLFLNQVFRFAVPLFFMISGFVLELNYHLHENYLTYLKKRLNRIFIPYVFWSLIYYCFVYYKNRNPNFLDSLLRGDASYQLYFIPAILIFYLLFPLMHKYIAVIGNRWVMILLFLIQLLLLFYDYHIRPLPLFYPLSIALLNYYAFIFGIILARNQGVVTTFINKWKMLLLLGAIAFGMFVFYQGFSGYLLTQNYLTFYSQWRPSVLLYTFFLSGFLYWFFNKMVVNVSLCKTLAKLSFFVFFIHVIVLETLWHAIGINVFQLQFAQDLWWDPVFFSSVTLVSFSLAYMAHKIPYLSKLTG